MKYLKFFTNNIFLFITLFFLLFIPLYPKIPLIDIQSTWVYIRIEDFIVFSSLIIFLIALILRKVTIRTPLTIPIIAFWIVGLVSTAHAILYIFPTVPGTFNNLAILHYLRRIEYMSLFFIGFAAMKDRRFLKYIVAVISVTVILISVYGFLQKGYFIGFENRLPAFSTMNEEFAKGIPLKLSAVARVTSTFAGHYDLAAYLVLFLPLMGSLIIGVKKWWLKLYFLTCYMSGFLLLLLTSSRISFLVYLFAISFMLFIHKKRLLIIPVIIASLFISNLFDGMTQRFQSTLTQADLIVDARTGQPIGIGRLVNNEYVIEDELSTGENLPQGSGYLGDLSGQTGSIDKLTYVKSAIKDGKSIKESEQLEGNYYVKKVLAYDISFTTRFQGTWPRAINAFNRNIFLGSGYSSIDLASDGNYLRILGEVGILGLVSFGSIFLILGIYIKNILPKIKNQFESSFVLGISAGIAGLGLNAVLIDVFEASKVAFSLWLIIGVTVGLLVIYKKQKIDYLQEIIRFFTSTPMLGLYLVLVTIGAYVVSLKNFFVGDDFTWLKWVADCKKLILANGQMICEPKIETVKNYFLDSEGFFYRPGTKIYFLIMYPWFALNQNFYHFASIALHAGTGIVIFLLSIRILASRYFGFLTALTFLFLSINSEIIVWTSATGHLIAFFLIAFSVYLYMVYLDSKNIFALLLSILSAFISVFFYEVGIITPILIIAYDLILRPISFKKIKEKLIYLAYLWIIPAYLFLRFNAKSHFMQGDYSYNLEKLPFNVVGNLVSYLMSVPFGTQAIYYSQFLREYTKQNLLIMIALSIMALLVIGALGYFFRKRINKYWINIGLISISTFVIPLIIFLGLGNVAPRYVYISSFGVVLFGIAVVKALSDFLNTKLKYFGFVLAFVIVGLFCVYQYTQFLRINKDWNRAGEISRSLVYGINETFILGSVKITNPVFYFLNVPIRYGEAWVFPVGLDDAVWFNYQNANLTVKFPSSLKLALEESEGSKSAKIFEFDEKGNINEINRIIPESDVK